MKLLTRKQRGFTLIELLVVIAIIGLLATIAVVALNRARATARQTKVEADLSTIAKAVEMLTIDTGLWPGGQTPYGACDEINPPNDCAGNELEDLNTEKAGLTKFDADIFSGWNGPYMNIIPKDPWGHNYFFDNDYTINGQVKAVVGSYGPNGGTLNDYDNDDIYYVISR